MSPPYAAELRVYEPLSAFPSEERGRWEDYAAGHAPATRNGAREEWDTGLLIACRTLARVPRSGDFGDHAYVLRGESGPLVCPWRSEVRSWSAAAELPELLPAEVVAAVLPAAEVEFAVQEQERWLAEHPRLRPHILTSRWVVPVRWFLLFDREERRLQLGPRQRGPTARWTDPPERPGRSGPGSAGRADPGGTEHSGPGAAGRDDPGGTGPGGGNPGSGGAGRGGAGPGGAGPGGGGRGGGRGRAGMRGPGSAPGGPAAGGPSVGGPSVGGPSAGGPVLGGSEPSGPGSGGSVPGGAVPGQRNPAATVSRSLVYRTPMAQARRRVARGVVALRRAFDMQPVVVAVESVGRWLEEFHPRSVVELDYGGIVDLREDAELRADDSAGDVAAALAALAKGDVSGAGAAYDRVIERWRIAHRVESAN